MGHYWRETDPKGAEEHDSRIARLLRLREALKKVPLSEFTVGELPAVMKLTGAYHNSAGQIDPCEEEVELLEAKVCSSS